MPISRIRGGTSISHEQSINDPDLLAKLEDLNQYIQAQAARRIQAAVDKPNADYQPPPNIHTPDREDSPPVGGLPSPASSPLPDYPHPTSTQPVTSATNNFTSSQSRTSSTEGHDPGSRQDLILPISPLKH
ncbi:MAG: hypothetical protein Q9217_004349 [Psora testacea]